MVVVEEQKLTDSSFDGHMSLEQSRKAEIFQKAARRKLANLVHVLQYWRQAPDTDTLGPGLSSTSCSIPCMLECLGHLEDNNNNTFSLVFALPVLPSDASTKDICTLKDKLDDRTYQPTLEQRFELARTVCTSILRLHCWGWIQKDIRSENILLVPHEDGGLNAYLCGFEVARHESDSSDLATVTDPEKDIYPPPAATAATQSHETGRFVRHRSRPDGDRPQQNSRPSDRAQNPGQRDAKPESGPSG